MNALIDAVATSVLAEVANAGTWTIDKTGPMWRNPRTGKTLFVYQGRELPGNARWTGGQIDVVEIVCEYVEPAPEQSRDLKHDQAGEYAANDVARDLREWALAHEAGFSPAYKMDWVGTDYTNQVARELFVRYCRVTFQFEVAVNFA